MTRWKPALAAAAVLGGALAWASAAQGEVKAGVDAWSAGDFARAVAEWRGPAAKGDADALFNLAQAYRLGRGVPMDLKQAETFYARAAAKGHLKAADNYGLLLFQDGRREQALPYVSAAAERGDPRAQYLVGIAHFNGDLLARDWVKAYALMTLANAAGLPQAGPAIRQMDQHVPFAQRQQAQSLAAQLRVSADARRSSEMAAADLGSDAPGIVGEQPMAASAPVVAARSAQPVERTVAPSIAAAEAAVAEAMRATGTESPATAGADYARPAAPRPARDLAQATPALSRPRESAPSPPPPPPAARDAGGPWKLQLGAFSVAGNAQRAWSQVAGHPALAGKARQTDAAGRLTRLLAAGWPSQSAAQAACNRLKASGHSCIVTR